MTTRTNTTEHISETLKRVGQPDSTLTREEIDRRVAKYYRSKGIHCDRCLGYRTVTETRTVEPESPLWQKPLRPDINARPYEVLVSVPCPECKGQRETEQQAFIRRLRKSLPADYWHMGFDAWNLDLNPRMNAVYRHVHAWAQHPAGGIVLSGSNGNGKTHLAAAAGLEAVRNGLTARFFDTNSLQEHLRQQVRQGIADNADHLTAAKDFLADALNVFILDELGGNRTTEFGEDAIEGIISRRYMGDRPFLITTNVGPNEWGERLTSRFYDRSRVRLLMCEGEDVRPKLRPQEQRLIS